MGLRARVRRLQKATRGTLDCIVREDGTRFWFSPEDVCKELFGYWSESLRAV